MDRILRKAFYILLYISLFLSSLYIINYFLDTSKTKEQSNLLNEISIDKNLLLQDNSETEPQAPQKTERMLKLEELQKENSDIVAWLEIEGTAINYPVLQGTDNDFYMTHNYKKEYTSSRFNFLR